MVVRRSARRLFICGLDKPIIRKREEPDIVPGLFYTSYYTNARRILENLLFGRIVTF